MTWEPKAGANLEGWGGEGGVRGVQEEGVIPMPMASPYWCVAEAITTLKSNYPPI